MSASDIAHAIKDRKFSALEAAEAALAGAGIDPMARGEQIDVGAFARIAEGLPR